MAGAQAIEETLGHALALQQSHGAGVGVGQHCLGAVFVDDGGQTPGDLRQRLVPTHRLKLAAALGPDTLQRRRQPIRVVDAIQIAVDLAAEPSQGHRMVRVAPDIDGAAAGAVNGDLPSAGVGTIVGTDAGHDFDGWIALIVGCFRHGFSRIGRIVARQLCRSSPAQRAKRTTT